MLSLERQNELREEYRRRRPHWRPATELYASLVRSRLRPGHRLLDLGCGRGGLVEQLNHPLPQTMGLDPDLASLRHHRLDLVRVQGTSAALPFAGKSFDVTIASWLLEHVPQPARDMREVARVLRPGGAFIFITPNARHPLALLNRLLGRGEVVQNRLVQWLYGRAAVDSFPTYYEANSRQDLLRLAAASGLELEVLKAVADPTYLALNKLLFRVMQKVEEGLPSERKLHLVGLLKRP